MVRCITSNIGVQMTHETIGTPDNTCAQVGIPLIIDSYRVKIAVDVEQKGLVVISDNYHKGWKARVDGKPTPILLANYIMRAVPVSAGHHEIEMVFRPKLLLAGIFITAAGWALLAILLWLCRPSKTTPRNG